MKTVFIVLFAAAASGILFSSCRHRDSEGFVTAVLPADSLSVPRFSGYTSWVRQGDKVVTYSLPGDTNFSVYRLPDFEYLYSFNAVEDRPDNHYAAGLFPSAADSALYIFSLKELFLSRFDVGEDTVRLEDRYPGAQKIVYINGIVLPDSLVLVGTMNFLEKRHDISLMDVRRWDTLQHIDSKAILDRAFHPVNYPLFASSRGRVVLAYKDYKRLEYYALSPAGRLEFLRAVGKDYDRDGVVAMKADLTPLDGPVDVSWGEKGLYLLENAVNKERKILASRIEVFDWDGNGRYRLQLERPATKILADESRGKLYALNPSLDSARVYVYDIGSFID